MKGLFQCDFCDHLSKGGTIGDYQAMEEHEDKCQHNPKNHEGMIWDKVANCYRKPSTGKGPAISHVSNC